MTNEVIRPMDNGQPFVRLKRAMVVPWHEILTQDEYHITSLCGVTMVLTDTQQETWSQIKKRKQKTVWCKNCISHQKRMEAQDADPNARDEATEDADA